MICNYQLYSTQVPLPLALHQSLRAFSSPSRVEFHILIQLYFSYAQKILPVMGHSANYPCHM